MMQRPERLATTTADRVQALRAVLFDLDGVFYAEETPLPGGARILALLDRAGLPFMAITNNARMPPQFYARRLASMGVPFPADQILTAAQAAAQFVAGGSPGARVLALGSPFLRDCLLAAGLELTEDAPDFVVAGMDESLTLDDLARACLRLRSGAALIVTNPDAFLPTAQGGIPSSGALKAYLETASEKSGLVIGKPEPHMFHRALQLLGSRPEETLMVGDNPKTDIAGARRTGLMTALIGPAARGLTEADLTAPDLEGLAECLEGYLLSP